MTTAHSFGDHLRTWRAQRRFSQLDLALEADVSARHISFLESGRSKPSRDMVMHLADRLDLPLRERNALLQAAGFAAAYPETPLDDASLAPVRTALERMLAQHMPMPAVLFDRYWNLIDANPTAAAMFGVTPGAEPLNIVAMVANNPGFTAQFENWPDVAHHMMERLKLELAASGGDPKLEEVMAAFGADPVFDHPSPEDVGDEPLIYLRLKMGGQTIGLFSCIAQFGTARNITVNDLRLELFFPEDEISERVLRGLAETLVS